MVRQQGGFTLMETIVALVVFSSVFVALYKGIEKGGGSIRRANMEATASTVALSRLASAGIEIPLHNGQTYTGEEDQFSWRMSIQQLAAPDGEIAARAKAAAFWVDVEVSWREGARRVLRSANYRSLKLGMR